MTLGSVRSETRSLATSRGKRHFQRPENALSAKALPEAEECRKRRDFYQSAHGDRRGLYRSGTDRRDPFRNLPPVNTAFAAQVIGQVLETCASAKANYAPERRPMSALLLDRSV